MDIETAILQSLRDMAAYTPRPNELIVSPDQHETITTAWETWEIERMLRERFGWGVAPRPVLNRHERRRARKVTRA